MLSTRAGGGQQHSSRNTKGDRQEMIYKGVTLAALQKYKYQPLNSHSAEIRLFDIHPADHDTDIITGTLSIAGLPRGSSDGEEKLTASTYPYRALSYEWGPADQLFPIIIDDKILEIRRNLFDFLQSYRRVLRTDSENAAAWPKRQALRFIWIDQLCIDQSSISERSAQVSLMHMIYSNAVEVVSWLADPRVEQRLYNILAYLRQWPAEQEQWRQIRDPKDHTELKVHSYDYRTFLEVVSEASYWSRVWVQQEIALAKEVILGSGDVFVSCQELRPMDITLPEVIYCLHPHLGRFGEHKVVLRHLSHILSNYARKLSHDSRDKVFGLMAMVVSEDQVEIDYNLTTAEVFKQALKKVLQSQEIHQETYSKFLREWTALAKSMNVTDFEDEAATKKMITQTRKQYATQDHLLPCELMHIRSDWIRMSRPGDREEW